MTELKLTQRSLLEVVFEKEGDSHAAEIKWLEQYAVFAHREHEEFMLFVPGYNEVNSFIKSFYPKIPPTIETPLIEAAKIMEQNPSNGYLLIAFV